jgi:uncharacterized protein
MIPEFPKFKHIELSDKNDVEKITSEYPPYSDFNFVSMWSWDVKGEMQISQLHSNLVVKFNDYLTGEPFYSFLGTNEVTETVRKLLGICQKGGCKSELDLIPKNSVTELDQSLFLANETRDHFDYIYDLTQISTYKGGQFAQKRTRVNQFTRNFPEVQIELLDLNDRETQLKIIELDTLWLESKIKRDPNFKVKNELLATLRFFEGNFTNVIGTGIHLNGDLIAYSIFSIVPDQYAISHFCKANTNHNGAYDFLIKESAKILMEKGCLYLNYEQDLGLPGLRTSKSSFTSNFFKKYTVRFPH